MTSFADLDALAAKAHVANDPGRQHPNGVPGALVRAPGPSPLWSYPGCPMDGSNLRLPRESAAQSRVQAALTSGEWVTSQIDNAGAPLAVVPAASTLGSRGVPIRPHEVGSARGAGPASGYMLRDDAPYPNAVITGVWALAWRSDMTTPGDGSGVPDTLLTFDVTDTASGGTALIPVVGSHVTVRQSPTGPGSRYTVVSVNISGGVGPIGLKRFSTPSGAAADGMPAQPR